MVHEQGYGVRSVEGGEPVDTETVFQIASLSKPVSSTVVAGLVGRGVLEWEDPVREHAPELQLSDEWVSDHVTFADLFAHRSGLPGGPAGNDLESVGYDRDTILERLALVPLEGFRDTYSYSNWGLTMSGQAAAVAAGWDSKTVADIEALFEPAGMDHTSMRHDDFVAEDNRAELHVPGGEGEWVADFERDPAAQAPAGGVSSNVGDLARWV
ncbi:MAG: serine hydrolase domain-containing protein [Acidimicrobiia bacterium]|nr:serine hydrolase domain-containing protein [Acidimicrobiia bacterium]